MASHARQQKLADEVLAELTATLAEEYRVLRKDSSRISDLIGEAAESLRADFKMIDRLTRNLALSDEDRTAYQVVYQRIVSTLQFEDIVTQIIEHQLARSGTTLEILEKLDTTEAADARAAVSMLEELNETIATAGQKHTTSASVLQQDLAVGDIELF